MTEKKKVNRALDEDTNCAVVLDTFIQAIPDSSRLHQVNGCIPYTRLHLSAPTKMQHLILQFLLGWIYSTLLSSTTIHIWICSDQTDEWHENMMGTTTPASFMFLRVGVILVIPFGKDSIFYLFIWMEDSWRLNPIVTAEWSHLQKNTLCFLCGRLTEKFVSREEGSPVEWQELQSQLYVRLSAISILELAMVASQWLLSHSLVGLADL